MALSKFEYNSFDVTPVASNAFAFNSTPNGLTTAASGSLNLIKTQTASSSASISFIHGTSDVVFDGTYDTYMFKFINIHPQTENAGLGYNFTTDGTNFNVSKQTVHWRSFHDESDSGTYLDYQTAKDLANGTGDQPITWDVENDADASTSGELFVFSPSSTTFVKHFMHQSNGMHSNPAVFTNFSAGYCNTTSAITGAIFKYTSGNMDAGTIKLYGITK